MKWRQSHARWPLGLVVETLSISAKKNATEPAFEFRPGGASNAEQVNGFNSKYENAFVPAPRTGRIIARGKVTVNFLLMNWANV